MARFYVFDINNDSEFAQLVSQGLTGSLNDMQFAFLVSQGYEGSLSDMLNKYVENPVVSGDAALMEDGFYILLEDGSKLLLEA